MRLLTASPIVCAGMLMLAAGCQPASQPTAPVKVGPKQVVLEIPGMV